MFKFMSDINLQFVDRIEESNEAKYMRKFIEDWASLVYDSSVYYDKIHDSSVNYLDLLDSSQISFTFKCDMFGDE